MKILIISNSLWNLNNFRKNLILHLDKLYDVTILSEQKKVSSNDFVIDKSKYLKIQFNSNSYNILSNFFLFLKIFKIIFFLKPDVILSFTIKPNIFSSLASKILGINNIVNITGLGTVFLQKKIKSKLFIKIYKNVFSRTNLIYFQNEYDLKFFKNNKILYPNTNYKIIPGSGVDLEKFYFNNNINKTQNFSFISRLLIEKGVIELFEAIKIIKTKHKNVNFNIIGNLDPKNKSSINPSLLDSMINLKFINYRKFTNNVIKEIKDSDCIILPSYREGSSKILIETAAMGKPAIATDVPGCNNIIKHNFNGFLCEPKNIKSLTNAIEKFINLDLQTKQKFSINARKHIENNFDEKFVINTYINDISSICEHK